MRYLTESDWFISSTIVTSFMTITILLKFSQSKRPFDQPTRHLTNQINESQIIQMRIQMKQRQRWYFSFHLQWNIVVIHHIYVTENLNVRISTNFNLVVLQFVNLAIPLITLKVLNAMVTIGLVLHQCVKVRITNQLSFCCIPCILIYIYLYTTLVYWWFI